MHDLDDVKVLDLVGSWFTCRVRSMFRGMPGLHLVCSWCSDGSLGTVSAPSSNEVQDGGDRRWAEGQFLGWLLQH